MLSRLCTILMVHFLYCGMVTRTVLTLLDDNRNKTPQGTGTKLYAAHASCRSAHRFLTMSRASLTSTFFEHLFKLRLNKQRTSKNFYKFFNFLIRHFNPKYYCKIYFNIIHYMSSKWSVTWRFITKKFNWIFCFPLVCYTCRVFNRAPADLILWTDGYGTFSEFSLLLN
jgi:hypothetical protein